MKRYERTALLVGIVLVLFTCGWAMAQQQPPPAPTDINIQPRQGQTEPQAADQGIVSEPGQVPVVEVPNDQVAVPTTDVPSPAEPDHAREQLMWGLVMVYLLQRLKKTAWFPWLTEQTSGKIQAAWGFGLALATAFGVHLAVTGSVLDGSGATITISGVSWDVIKDVTWQWASQQAIYHKIVKGT